MTGSNAVTLMLCGDVMLGRGIDQVLPHPSAPALYEPHVRSALDYVDLAERANGPIPRPVPFVYPWGGAGGPPQCGGLCRGSRHLPHWNCSISR